MKIKQIICILMVLATVVGCSQYEYDMPTPAVEVKESVLEFDAFGGDGYILVESKSAISAESDATWCQVRVVDKRIVVTVASFDGMENRTALVTITSNDGTPMNVPVTQTASLFIVDNVSFETSYLQSTVKTHVRADNRQVSLSSDDTWLSAVYERDSVFITAQQNDGVPARTGTVQVKAGDIVHTLTVRQASSYLTYDDFLGEWDISFTNVSTGALVEGKATLSVNQRGSSYRISSSSFLNSYSFIIYYRESTASLYIVGGEEIGPNGSYDVVIGLMSTTNVFNSSSSVELEAIPVISPAGTVCAFQDNGSWPGYTIVNFAFGAYNAGGGSYVGTFARYTNITLTK